MCRVRGRPSSPPREGPLASVEHGTPPSPGQPGHPHPTTAGATRLCRGGRTEGQRWAPAGQGWAGVPKDLPGGQGSSGGPERSVSWGPARVQSAGFVWRARRGRGASEAVGPATAARWRQSPRRLAASSPRARGRPGRTAREARVSRCASPAPASATPGEIFFQRQISNTKADRTVLRKANSVSPTPPPCLFLKANLSPSFHLSMSQLVTP